jgi:hypothetical protein
MARRLLFGEAGNVSARFGGNGSFPANRYQCFLVFRALLFFVGYPGSAAQILFFSEQPPAGGCAFLGGLRFAFSAKRVDDPRENSWST